MLGLVWGHKAVSGALVQQMSGLVGEQGGRQIETIIKNASDTKSGIIATIIGVVTLILGATGVFLQLKDALNTVWEVKVKPIHRLKGVWNVVRNRALSLGVVLVIGFLLLASLVVSAAITALGTWMNDVLPMPGAVLQAINFIVGFTIIMFLFAVIFKWLPDVKIAWRDVWAGAAATALLFSIGKFALGLYLGRSAVGSVFGAAGSVIVILLWIYYASIIFLLGAEFTQVYARRWGTRIEPSPLAEFVWPQDRADQGLAVSAGGGRGKPGQSQRQSQRGPSCPHKTCSSRPLQIRNEHRLTDILAVLAIDLIEDAWRNRRPQRSKTQNSLPNHRPAPSTDGGADLLREFHECQRWQGEGLVDSTVTTPVTEQER